MEQQRLPPIALVLRALAAAAPGRPPHEPLLHVKRLLAEHAEEDLAAAAALDAPTAAPAPALRALVDPIASRAALQRALADAVRDDPALLPLALAQDRHADAPPARHPAAPAGGLPLEAADGDWPPPHRPAPARGARDPFVIVEPGAAPDAIDDAVRAAESAAAAGDATEAAAQMRHATRLDRERLEAGDPWGARPVPDRP